MLLKISLAIILLILTLSGCGRTENETLLLDLEGQKIQAELAKTPQERFKGLSGREHLCENCGMLFVFPQRQERSFVMRDMNFPLDVIWIRDQKIVNIDKDAPPEGSNPKKEYRSQIPVDKVLELNAGFCDAHEIKIGDKIEIMGIYEQDHY